MNDSSSSSREANVDLGAYDAWLFDMDGVLTQTAAVHAAPGSKLSTSSSNATALGPTHHSLPSTSRAITRSTSMASRVKTASVIFSRHGASHSLRASRVIVATYAA